MNPEACLPAGLRAAGPAITSIGDGLSGARVYRVDAGGEAFVLKIAPANAPLAGWRRTLDLVQRAAHAGLAPPVVHVDEERRAVVSAFVADRSFFALWGNPETRDAALALLGRTIRRVHALPLPPDATPADPRDFLARVRAGLAGFPLPPFVGELMERMLATTPPAATRAPVLSHNDVHPANFIYDGERLLLLDWDVAAPNDPFYDLAVIALFLRMDEATARRLLEAYDEAPQPALPAGFVYHRRLAAVLCGANFLGIARQRGHGGATGRETPDDAPSLAGIYQRMRGGAFDIASAEGQWAFGLALLGESAAQ